MVTYRAILDVPREAVLFLTRLLAAERTLRGTRKRTRALTCYHQAIMVLRHFRDGTDPATLARDHGIGRSTGYRYIDEATAVLADQARTCTTHSSRLTRRACPTWYSTGK